MAELERIELIITTDNKAAIAALKKVQKELGDSGKKASEAESKFKKFSTGARGAFATLGVGIGIAAIVSLGKSFARLQIESEKALTKVATLANFTTQELDDMRKGTAALQRQFGISFTQISEARFDVVSSGFADVTEQQELLTKAFILGAGNATDVSVATSVLTGTLKAFGLGAEDASRVMDELTVIAQGSKTNLEGLATAIAKVAPSAVQAGQSLATAGAALDILTLAGISADESATALKGALDSLITPVTQKNFEKAKIGIKDIETGAVRPLVDILKDMQKLTPEALRTLIPDKTAAQGFSILIANIDAFRAAANKIESEDAIGATARAAAKTMATLDTKIKILSQTFNSFLQEGTFFGEQLKIVINGLTQALLLLRGAAGDNADEQEDAANKTTKAQQRVINIQKQIEEAVNSARIAENTLSANVFLNAEVRERFEKREETQKRLLIGLTKQLTAAQKEFGKELSLASLRGEFKVAPRVGEEVLGPALFSEEEIAAKKAEAAATESRLDVEELITKIKADGVQERLVLINKEFDVAIQKAIDLGGKEEQFARIELLREKALAKARLEIRNKAAAEAEKREKELGKIIGKRIDAQLELREKIAKRQEEIAARSASKSENIFREEAAKEDQIVRDADALFNKGQLSKIKLNEILIASEQRLRDAVAARIATEAPEEGGPFADLTEEQLEFARDPLKGLVEGADEALNTIPLLQENLASTIPRLEAMQAASEAMGAALIDQAIAGKLSGKALGKAAQQAAVQVLKAKAAEAAGLAIFNVASGFANLALGIFFPPALAAAQANFAAAAAFASVAAVTGGAAAAIGGGGGGGGGGGAQDDVTRAQQRRRDADLDERGGIGGPGITIITNLTGVASRSQLAIVADEVSRAAREQFDTQQITQNLGTVQGQ